MKSSDDPKPVAVFVHAFHPDVWATIVERLEAIMDEPFHLVVTAPPEIAATLPLPDPRLLASATILPCENRGRDVRPFCAALRLAVDYDVGVKLHTKRSTHRLDGTDWGREIVGALLPDAPTVRRIHAAMLRDPRLAMAAPNGMLVSQNPWMRTNRGRMDVVAGLLGFDPDEALDRTPVFAAGTMFWFRREALSFLADPDLDALFEPEAGQVDGTTAHAVERWIAPIAETGGRVATTVEGVLAADPDAALEDLRTASRRLADRPNAFLVPPGVLGRLLDASPRTRAVWMRLPRGLRRMVRSALRPADRPR